MKGVFKRGVENLIHRVETVRKKYREFIKARAYSNYVKSKKNELFSSLTHDKKIHFSIIVPVFNPEKKHFEELINSIINQSYQRWELILVNVSNKSHQYLTKDATTLDNRIKEISRENKSIAENTNEGIREAQGNYIVFVDHDDLLHRSALSCIAEKIQEEDSDVVYTDEDKVSHDGNHYFSPFIKPDFDLFLLESVNYINHLTAIRKSALPEALLRKECNGAQDLDLLLRTIDSNPKIKVSHIPQILYHWRAAKSSTAADIANKSYIFESGVKALNGHYERINLPVTTAAISNKPGFYRPDFTMNTELQIVFPLVDSRFLGSFINWFNDTFKKFTNTTIFLPEALRVLDRQIKQKDIRIEFFANDNDLKQKIDIKLPVTIMRIAVKGDLEKLITEMTNIAIIKNAAVIPYVLTASREVFLSGSDDANGLSIHYADKYDTWTPLGHVGWPRTIKGSQGLFITLSQGHLNESSLDEVLNQIAYKRETLLWPYNPPEFVNRLTIKNESLPNIIKWKDSYVTTPDTWTREDDYKYEK